MKNLKKIGAMILVVAMLCVCSVSAFAADVEFTGTTADHDIEITSVSVDRTTYAEDGIWEVLVNYEITGDVAGKQITMLGYIFDGAATGEATNTTPVEGKIRAIDQQAIDTDGSGTVSFKLAKNNGEDYTIDGTETMVVKFGTDVEGVESAQAFYFSPAPAKYAVTFSAGTYGESGTPEGSMTAAEATQDEKYELPACEFTIPEADAEAYEFKGWKINGTGDILPAGTKVDITAATELVAQWGEKATGILGDVNEDGFVDGLDAVAVQEFDLYDIGLAREDLGDVNGDDYVDGLDAVAIQEFDLYDMPFQE